MNLKELKELIVFVEKVIDIEDVQVCIDVSRDGKKSFPKARVSLTKSESGETILVAGYG